MIGPQTKKMSNKKVCTGCEMLIQKEMGGSVRFPKKWIVNYCKHPGQRTDNVEISLIGRGIPYTKGFCPA